MLAMKCARKLNGLTMKYRRNRKHNMTPEEKQEIIKLYQEGVKTIAISVAYHRGPNTINDLLDEFNIPKRRAKARRSEDAV